MNCFGEKKEGWFGSLQVCPELIDFGGRRNMASTQGHDGAGLPHSSVEARNGLISLIIVVKLLHPN